MNVKEHERAWLLVSALARALAHEIRTPLSVISNDLYYLQTLGHDKECARSLARCRDITGFLNSTVGLRETTIKMEAVELVNVLKEVFVSNDISLGNVPKAPVLIRGDETLLKQGLEHIKELFEKVATKGKGAQSAQVTLDVETKSSGVNLGFEIKIPLAYKQHQAKSDSLTEFFCSYLNMYIISSVFADSILWAHGCVITVGLNEDLRVGIEFPVCE